MKCSYNYIRRLYFKVLTKEVEWSNLYNMILHGEKTHLRLEEKWLNSGMKQMLLKREKEENSHFVKKVNN